MSQSITLLALILASLTLFNSGCSKKDRKNDEPLKNTSYWMVNNDTIPIQNINVYTAPIRAELRLTSKYPNQNTFSVVFWETATLPLSGTYRVDYIASTPDLCNVNVNYNGKIYDVAQPYNNTFVKISIQNNKGRYELEPTWFYYQLDSSDSILVKGVAYQP